MQKTNDKQIVNRANGQGKYLTPTECAQRLNIAPVTLRKWAQKGMLEAVVTPGGHRRYAIETIEQFAKQYQMPLQQLADDELRILVVDDDEQVCRYLSELFASFDESIRTEAVQDGFEAGHKIHTFAPQVVLMDLMMPGIDGFDVCRLIKSHSNTQHIRIIAITGFHSQENCSRAIEAGAEACLQKPIKRNELFDVIGLKKQISI